MSPRAWSLWTLRPRVVAGVLVVELGAVAWVVQAALAGPPPSVLQWGHLGVLAAAALAHVQLSRRAEERRRTDGTRLHIDVLSIWTFPAALLLPLPLVAVLIAATRWQRHRIARKPLYKATLTAASIMLAACSAHTLTAAAYSLAPARHVLVEGVVVLGAAAVFCVQQILLIGVVILLEADQRPSWSRVFGTPAQWREMYLAISLGIAVAFAQAHPVLVVVMAGVATALNRLVGARASAERAALTDGLTKVHNKAGWQSAGMQLLHRAAAAGRAHAVVVLDLDHFKRVNDDAGHLIGDRVLEEVAKVLLGEVRAGDLVARIGGEEFVIALADADVDEARRVASRLLEGIRDLRIPATFLRGGDPVIIGGPGWPCTASIGVAVGTSLCELDALLGRADEAMYQAKHGGRDQVVIAGDSQREYAGAGHSS